MSGNLQTIKPEDIKLTDIVTVNRDGVIFQTRFSNINTLLGEGEGWGHIGVGTGIVSQTDLYMFLSLRL